MSYEVRITQTRPNTDQDWYVFDPTVTTTPESIERGDRLEAWLDMKESAGVCTKSIEFAGDHLSWSWINTFADEAAFDAFNVEYDAFIEDTSVGLSGIAWRDEPIFVQWLADTDSTVSITYATI